MKVLLTITVICFILNVITLRTMSRKAKKYFTKEELKIYKKNSKRAYAWYIYYLFIACPVINVLFCIAIGILYNELIEKVTGDIREVIEKEQRWTKTKNDGLKAI